MAEADRRMPEAWVAVVGSVLGQRRGWAPALHPASAHSLQTGPWAAPRVLRRLGTRLFRFLTHGPGQECARHVRASPSATERIALSDPMSLSALPHDGARH